MKAAILAGGFGTRLAEETGSRPKPMVEIGGRPILWHILKTYHVHGTDFSEPLVRVNTDPALPSAAEETAIRDANVGGALT